ncbi:MAG: hypothetical protein H0W72_09760, partial [Planctomycetes bacterium]|nr:hypothetical protein [Planctomycetota bacterium]
MSAVDGFVALRVVRSGAGEPSVPAFAPPAGWRLVDEPDHLVASPGECYAFLAGPRGAHGAVAIAWPGVDIAA